jgi:hypothetical protein
VAGDELDRGLAGTIPLAAAGNGAGPGAGRARRSHRAQPRRSRPGRRRRWPIMTAALAVLVAVVVAGGYLAVQWTQGQYYLADGNGQVVIYRGIPSPARVLWIRLSHLYAQTGIPLGQVPANYRQTVTTASTTGSLSQAQQAVTVIRKAVQACQSQYQALQFWVVAEDTYQAEVARANAAHKPAAGFRNPGPRPGVGRMCQPPQAFGISPATLSPATATRS